MPLRAAVAEQAATEQSAAAAAFTRNPALEQKLASRDRWVVFSDLHVHQKFEPHWQEALVSVHDLATKHSAGVLFLVRPHNCSLRVAPEAQIW